MNAPPELTCESAERRLFPLLRAHPTGIEGGGGGERAVSSRGRSKRASMGVRGKPLREAPDSRERRREALFLSPLLTLSVPTPRPEAPAGRGGAAAAAAAALAAVRVTEPGGGDRPGRWRRRRPTRRGRASRANNRRRGLEGPASRSRKGPRWPTGADADGGAAGQFCRPPPLALPPTRRGRRTRECGWWKIKRGLFSDGGAWRARGVFAGRRREEVRVLALLARASLLA